MDGINERHVDAAEGGGEIEVRPVPFPDLLTQIRRACRAAAKRMGLYFAIDIRADVPPAIVTNVRCLQSLLHSLLAAAIESTREGGVALRIRRAKGCTPQTMWIAFDVVDTGSRHGDSAPPHLVEAAAWLGGYLVCSGAPGQGHLATVYLPLRLRCPIPGAAAARSSSPPAT